MIQSRLIITITRGRSDVIGNRAGQKKGNLRKPTTTEGRLDFYENVLALKRYKEKCGLTQINSDNQEEFHGLVNFCRRNRFHYRQHMQGAKVMKLGLIGRTSMSMDQNI